MKKTLNPETIFFYFGVLGSSLKKTSVIFEISILEFCKMQMFHVKQKKFKSETKIALFGYFYAAILKDYSHM